jgi:hypothetical protein
LSLILPVYLAIPALPVSSNAIGGDNCACPDYVSLFSGSFFKISLSNKKKNVANFPEKFAGSVT